MIIERLVCCGWLIILMFLLGCNPCKEEIWSNVPSPDGRWTAVTVIRDCGATTGEVLSVNIRPAGEKKLSAENNALVIKHGYALDAIWKDATTITIECRECVPKEIAAKHDSVGPVHVLYSLPK
jgi:hypothetical protein